MSILTLLLILATIWVQMNVITELPMSGTLANMGIVLVTGLGLVSGNFVGGLVGFVYGLLADIAWGRVLGLSTLLYTIAGVGAGFLNRNFSKENKLSMVMLSLLTTVVLETILYMFYGVGNRYEFEVSHFITMLILESAYNMLLTIWCFRPIAWFGEKINWCKSSRYLG